MNTRIFISTYEQYASRATVALGAALAISLFLYGAFLILAVEHTAARAAAEQKIAAESTRLSALEGRYLTQARDFTLERAMALGFVQAAQTITLFSDAKNSALTLRGQ